MSTVVLPPVIAACGFVLSIAVWLVVLRAQRHVPTSPAKTKRYWLTFAAEVILVALFGLAALSLSAPVNNYGEKILHQAGFDKKNSNSEYKGRCSIFDSGVRFVTLTVPIAEEAASRAPLALLSAATPNAVWGGAILATNIVGSTYVLSRARGGSEVWLSMVLIGIVIFFYRFSHHFNLRASKSSIWIATFILSAMFAYVHGFNYGHVPYYLVPLLVWPQFTSALIISTLSLRYGPLGLAGGMIAHGLLNFSVLLASC